MYGYDPARTAYAPEREMPPDGASAQYQNVSLDSGQVGGVDAAPAVGDEHVYVAGDRAIDRREVDTGARRWAYDPDDGVSTTPALGCGAVFVATLNGVVALGAESGDVLWRSDAIGSSEPEGSPVLDGDTLYLGGHGGVVALDAETGRTRWTGGAEGVEQGVAVTDRVYVTSANRDDGWVESFTRDGDEWWTREVGPAYTSPVVADGVVYVVTKNGTLHALDAHDGSVTWRADVSHGVTDPPAVADGVVVVNAGNGDRAYALDASTGERLWTHEVGPTMAPPAVFGDTVLVPGANTGIHALDVQTGDLITHWDVDAAGSTPVLAGGRIYYRSWSDSLVHVVG